jgi:hypothetical protein
MSKHDEETPSGNKSKFAGLKKLSSAQLAELLKAVSGEIEKRALKAKDSKSPASMSDKEFQTWAAKQIATHSTGKDDDDGE